MNFSKLVILFFILYISSLDSYSQKWKLTRYEIIGGVSSANYFGDIGGAKTKEGIPGLSDLKILSTRASIHGGLRYRIFHKLSVKTNVFFAFVSGKDEGSINEARNFSFSSYFFEPSVQLEYSLLPDERKTQSFAIFSKRGMINNYSKSNIYLIAGVGGVFFQPVIDFTPRPGKDITSGYSKSALVFPIGFGFYYNFTKRINLGFELSGRFTTTDYLDGFTTIYSKSNDIYYLGTVYASYKILTNRRGFPVFFPKGGASFFKR